MDIFTTTYRDALIDALFTRDAFAAGIIAIDDTADAISIVIAVA